MSDSQGNIVFLLLGSNRGNRIELLTKARQSIAEKAGEIIHSSSLYESEPWGFEDEISFINQVLEIKTNLSAEKLLKVLLDIESSLGRIRFADPASCILHQEQSDLHPVPGYNSRTIDLDILFYSDKIIFTESLRVPHPRLHERRFTLEPMNEIAPDLMHPILKKTVGELLAGCTDCSKVTIF